MNTYMRALIKILICNLLVCGIVGCTSETSQLYDALVNRNYDGIKHAADRGTDLDHIAIDGVSMNPILYLWKSSPRPLFIEQILKSGGNANYEDEDGNTLLMYASGYQPQDYGFESVSGHYSTLDYCKLFLQYGADVTQKNKKGWTALDYAVQLQDDYPTVELLLKHGAVVTPQVLSNAFNSTNDSYTDYRKIRLLVQQSELSQVGTIISPILSAAIRGVNDEVQMLAPQATTLSTNEKLQTLCYAVAFCDSDTVQMLIADNFGTINSIDATDNTLLEIAAAHNNDSVLTFLFTQKAWNDDVCKSALNQAVSNDCTKTCYLLLNSGTPVTTESVEQWEVFDNIMDCAAQNGNVEIIQMLIQHGYPVTSSTAWYAMKNAAMCGQTAVIQYWVSLGYNPDYNADNTNGDTSVLYDACLAEQLETVQYLLDIGCKVNAARKCLPAAVETGNIELVRLLLKYGAAVDETTVYEDGSKDFTAKEVAEQNGFGEIMTLLEEHQR